MGVTDKDPGDIGDRPRHLPSQLGIVIPEGERFVNPNG